MGRHYPRVIHLITESFVSQNHDGKVRFPLSTAVHMPHVLRHVTAPPWREANVFRKCSLKSTLQQYSSSTQLSHLEIHYCRAYLTAMLAGSTTVGCLLPYCRQPHERFQFLLPVVAWCVHVVAGYIPVQQYS